MTIPRTLLIDRRNVWALLLALGLGGLAPQPTYAASEATTARSSRQTKPFKSVYQTGLKKLPDGPLIKLMDQFDHADANQYHDCPRRSGSCSRNTLPTSTTSLALAAIPRRSSPRSRSSVGASSR
jgi:hypothetical protein